MRSNDTYRPAPGIRDDRRRRGLLVRPALAMRAALTAAVLVLAVPLGALAQQSQPAPPPTEPGILESIGRWFDEQGRAFRDHLRGAGNRAGELGEQAVETGRSVNRTASDVGKQAVEATREAVDSVARLPNARIVSGRQVCAAEPNRAPDCHAAALALCRSRGFKTGKSIDFTSAQRCPAHAWLGGRQANEAECTTETFITRAVCQ